MKVCFGNKKGSVFDNSNREGIGYDGWDWLCWGGCKDLSIVK